VLSEDQPGQRILWSYARASRPLLYSSPQVAFPNISSGEPCPQPHGSKPPPHTYPAHPSYLLPACAHLFAEPTVVLDGHVYLAASLRQFCLWPLDSLNEAGKYLLLRRVDLGGGGTTAPKLGKMFWASDPGPAWAATNVRLGIQLLAQMDSEARSDVAALLAGSRPCEPNASKCEWCEGGCQDLREAGAAVAPCKLADVGGPWIERTHWKLAGKEQGDVLLYRAQGSVLCFSRRTGIGTAASHWTLPAPSQLIDIHSNFNGGTLPDGRVYLLHNPIPGKTRRDPLVLSLSDDGFNFDRAFVAMSCRLPPVSPNPHASCPDAETCPDPGCKRRNPGGGSPGPQYPQGLVVDESMYRLCDISMLIESLD
jgi:hypothetical protein